MKKKKTNQSKKRRRRRGGGGTVDALPLRAALDVHQLFRSFDGSLAPVRDASVRGDANVNDVFTFLEDGYQLVPRTRKGASLNGCLGNNVELFPKFFFFFFFWASADRHGLGWVDKE